MGMIAKQVKSEKKTSRIESQSRLKLNKGTFDMSQEKVSDKKKNRYFSGGIKKSENLQSKKQFNKLKKPKIPFKINDSDIIRLQENKKNKATSVVSNVKHTLNFEKVKSCVSAMLEYESKNTKSKNKLFEDAQPIYMIVQGIRVPIMKSKNYRFFLPNSLTEETSEICLFVPNLKKGKNEDHEPTIEHFQDILDKHQIKGISKIIPLRQLQVEYDQYELRRHLVNQFDLFLADGRVNGHIQGLLGKAIYKKRKIPVPIDFRVKDLKKEVDSALHKTLMMMNGVGDKSSLKVGHTKQSVTQIAENIIAVAEGLQKYFPGGWTNIRSLKIHLQDRAPVPVYISLKSSNDVEVPIVTPTRPRKAVPVEGELSTMPGVHVIVLPDGEVVVKKKTLTKEDREMGLSDSDLEDFDSDEEMDAISSDEGMVPKDEIKIEPKPNKEETEDEKADSDVSSVGGDDDVEAAENAYLNEWKEQWNEDIKENSQKGKKRKEKADSESVRGKKTLTPNDASPLLKLSKKGQKKTKNVMKTEPGKYITKKQKFNKKLVSQEKKRKFSV